MTSESQSASRQQVQSTATMANDNNLQISGNQRRNNNRQTNGNGRCTNGNNQHATSGLLIIDKPQGVTSHDVVAAVRGALHTKRVGHAGTLDPMATGVLVVGFGAATRLLNIIVDHSKTYEATIRLGQRTTTDDADGTLIDSDGATAVAGLIGYGKAGAATGLTEPDGTNAAAGTCAGSDETSTTVSTLNKSDGTCAADEHNFVSDNGFAMSSDFVSSSDIATGSNFALSSVSSDVTSDSYCAADKDFALNNDSAPGHGSMSDGDSVAEQARTIIESTIAQHFVGDIEQVPSTFSAIKVNGRRAYDLARDGQDVKLKPRAVTIDQFDVLDIRIGSASTVTAGLPLGDRSENEPLAPVIDVDVRVSCSAGTYIRALARDLGELLGTGGYLTHLRRTRVGGYHIDDPRVITAHQETRTFTNRNGETVTRAKAVLDATADEIATSALSMVEAAAGALPVVAIDAEQARDLRFGRRIRLSVNSMAKAVAGVSSRQTARAVDGPRKAGTDQQKASGDGQQEKIVASEQVVSADDQPTASVVDKQQKATDSSRQKTSDGRLGVYVPETQDLVAIVMPCGGGMVKPVTVFPEEPVTVFPEELVAVSSQEK